MTQLDAATEAFLRNDENWLYGPDFSLEFELQTGPISKLDKSDAARLLDALGLCEPFRPPPSTRTPLGRPWNTLRRSLSIWKLGKRQIVGAMLIRRGEVGLCIAIPPRHVARCFPKYPWRYSPPWDDNNAVLAVHEAVLARLRRLMEHFELKVATLGDEAWGVCAQPGDYGVRVRREVAELAGWKFEEPEGRTPFVRLVNQDPLEP